MNIYVASSWRNKLQQTVVQSLRSWGHEVYDFRNPIPGNNGFSWKEIDPNWEHWTPEQYRDALKSEIAKRGYDFDMAALKRCDACILVLPSGRGASWEFGFAFGEKKRCSVLVLERCEPELMYREAEILTNFQELREAYPR